MSPHLPTGARARFRQAYPRILNELAMPFSPSSSIGADTVVQWSGTPLAASAGSGVVIMSVERGNYYELDAVGADVWRRLEQPSRVGDLCAALARAFAGDPNVIESDVRSLLANLLDHGLIEVRAL